MDGAFSGGTRNLREHGRHESFDVARLYFDVDYGAWGNGAQNILERRDADSV
jgi:hypothetical protein